MDLDVLHAELAGDPVALGYDGTTDAEATALLNSETTDRTRPRSMVTTAEIFSRIDPTEYADISNSSSKQAFLGHVLGLGEVDPFDTMIVQTLVQIFGSGSTTISNLNDWRNETVSRAVELGLGIVKVGHVTEARRL